MKKIEFRCRESRHLGISYDAWKGFVACMGFVPGSDSVFDLPMVKPPALGAPPVPPATGPGAESSTVDAFLSSTRPVSQVKRPQSAGDNIATFTVARLIQHQFVVCGASWERFYPRFPWHSYVTPPSPFPSVPRPLPGVGVPYDPAPILALVSDQGSDCLKAAAAAKHIGVRVFIQNDPNHRDSRDAINSVPFFVSVAINLIASAPTGPYGTALWNDAIKEAASLLRQDSVSMRRYTLAAPPQKCLSFHGDTVVCWVRGVAARPFRCQGFPRPPPRCPRVNVNLLLFVNGAAWLFLYCVGVVAELESGGRGGRLLARHPKALNPRP